MRLNKEEAAAAWQGNDGRPIDTKPLDKESIVNQITSAPTSPDFVCPVVGCTGPYGDVESHENADPALNLHNAEAKNTNLLEVEPAMFNATYGRWILSVEIKNEMTPNEAIEAADQLHVQAERVQAMNDAIEAEEWFDIHPNPGAVLVADLMRACSLAVQQIIVARLAAAPVIDYSGHTVANAAGYVIEPDTLFMRSLCNADEARYVDRSLYFVNVGA